MAFNVDFDQSGNRAAVDDFIPSLHRHAMDRLDWIRRPLAVRTILVKAESERPCLVTQRNVEHFDIGAPIQVDIFLKDLESAGVRLDGNDASGRTNQLGGDYGIDAIVATDV